VRCEVEVEVEVEVDVEVEAINTPCNSMKNSVLLRV
jgi:hypothetical protein